MTSQTSLPSKQNTPNWREVGLRRTPQREVVLRLVRSCFDHPTADWIHQQARRTIPDISLATVYRTLRVLKEKGLVHEFSGGASPSRFDGTVHEHEHVRCVRCGFVRDVDLPEAADIRNMVAQRSGFRIGKYPLLFHGLCAECVESSARKNGAEPVPSHGDDDSDRHLVEGHW